MVPRFVPSCCMLFFDCPTDTPLARRQLAKFRKAIKYRNTCTRATPGRNGVGWTLLRMTPEAAEALLCPLLPADAEMQVMPVTEAQMGKTHNFWGRMRKSADELVECGAQ